MIPQPPRPTLFPYTTLFRSDPGRVKVEMAMFRQDGPTDATRARVPHVECDQRLEKQSAFRTTARVLYPRAGGGTAKSGALDRKSTRLNSSHSQISYAVFCLK